MSKLFRLCLAMILSASAVLCAGAAFAASLQASKVIILPFEVNANEELAYLESSLPDLISERLQAEKFEIVPQADTKRLLEEQNIKALDIASVRDLALLSGANYAVYGSFNQIGEDISIDARIVEAYGLQPAKPVYISKNGLINIIPAIEELVAKVRNEVQRKRTINKITIRGTKILDPDVVLMRLRTRKGDALDGKKVNEEIKRIYKLGYFKDVQAAVNNTREGIELIFTVAEKPRVENITIEGSDEVDEEDILSAMSTKTGSVLNEKLLAEDLSKITELYRKEGYYLAKVTHRLIEGDGRAASLVLNIEEGEKLYIKEVTVSGVEQLDVDEIVDGLALRPHNMLSWFMGTGILREDYLERDTAAIGAYYLNRGFMDVVVAEPDVDYQEDGIVITFKVKEGPRYKIGNIVFKGDLIEPDARLLELVAIDNWKEDETYVSYNVLKEDMNKLTAFYSEHGYAYAEADYRTIASEEENTFDLEYKIVKKNRVFVRRVTIEGNTHTRDNVVRRALYLTDGDVFNGKKLQRSNSRLSGLGYFSQADVEMIPTENADEVDLKVKVKEQNTGAILAGLGWSTHGGVGVSGSVRESNLWGKGYIANLTGSFGADSTRYEFTFTDPRFRDTNLSVGFSSYIASDEFDDYDTETVGGTVSFGYPLSDKSVVQWGYRLDSYEVLNVDTNASDDIKDDEGDNLASVVNVGYTRSTINNTKRPTGGTFQKVLFYYGGGGIGGDDNFMKVVGESRAYYAFNSDHVLMGKVKGGMLFKNDVNDDVPLVERFWIGGINSVRGYKSSDFAVRDEATGDKVGGTRMAYANFEYQWYFNNDLGMTLVPFVDAGVNIDDEKDRDFQNDVLTSVGLEWRWKSPMGDLRFAYGVPLNKVNGERKDPRFEFAMGQSF